MRPELPAGRLFLLVGPSGSGKDSVLQALAAGLRPEHRVAVARRVITRPVVPGAPEQHMAVTRESFARLRAAGAFALDWESHGLAYGLGAEIRLWLAAGLSVLANGSRGALGIARARFGPALTVVHLTAGPEVLARRLAGRGRESPAEIEERLRRAALEADLDGCATIRNDGPLEEAVRALARLIEAETRRFDEPAGQDGRRSSPG